MTWQGIHGHDVIADRFRECLLRGRLASTYLFVGPAGIGKRQFALRLAQSLLCTSLADQELASCGTCAACQQVLADSHPDLEQIGLPEGRSFIPLDLLLGDKEHRLREGLCHRLWLKPAAGSRKIAIIDDADYFNQEGANCLLKTLEEPPPRSLLVLVGTSEQRQLPTIRSRCQIIRFHPLTPPLVAQVLLEKQVCADPSRVNQLACMAGGSLAQAAVLADPAMWEARREILEHLAEPNWEAAALARRAGELVDAAGKELSLRRKFMHWLVESAAEFYRHLMRELSGAVAEGDAALADASRRAHDWWHGGLDSAVDSLQRCLDAHAQIDANANQATFLTCFFDDLSQITLGSRLGVELYS